MCVCVHDLLDQGDARSAEQLAMMYVDGAGVHNDYKIALKWLAKTVRHRCSGSTASSIVYLILGVAAICC